jgi:hypothetical protein
MEEPMTSFKQRVLNYLQIEWGTYVERFDRLPVEEGIRRVNEMGYERFQDMLAHIMEWWDEGMGIILAVAEEREYEHKKYDFDAFNAVAVAKYKAWDETEFLVCFQQTRLKTIAGLMSMNEAAWEDERVRGWSNGIFISHAREHMVTLSRLLLLDILQNEWATYVKDFEALDDAKKKEFMSKQGFESFHDLLAHIIGWWEESIRVVNGILSKPNFAWKNPDTDAFNLELTKKYSTWSHADLLAHYETTRNAIMELIMKMPENSLSDPDIESWLASDVIRHYEDHAI